MAFAAAGAHPVSAQPAPAASAAQRTKGPLVWQGMDQADLDDAYDMRKASPNMPQVLRRYALNSEAVRERLGAPQQFAYGPTPIELLDVYTTRRAGAPVHVFLHGGAFRYGRARDHAFPAEMFVHAGVHFVVPDFVSAQDTGGHLMPLADQVRRAVAWVHRNAHLFGGNPDRIYCSGHSSGGHLAAVVLTTDWRALGLPADTVKGGLCCSATFDLTTFRLSKASAGIVFTDEVEEVFRTQRQLEHLNAPLILAYGSLDTAEFQRHARAFTAAAQASGKRVALLAADGYNHFELIETLASPYGVLGRAALQQMHMSPHAVP